MAGQEQLEGWKRGVGWGKGQRGGRGMGEPGGEARR